MHEHCLGAHLTTKLIEMPHYTEPDGVWHKACQYKGPGCEPREWDECDTDAWTWWMWHACTQHTHEMGHGGATLTHIPLPYLSNLPHRWGFMEGVGNGTLTCTLVYPYLLPVQV
jgi:hypothetical protein